MPLQFKLNQETKPQHNDVAASLCWTDIDEIVSCGDDHRVVKWNTETNEVSTLIQLAAEVYPITITWPPKNYGIYAAGRKTNDLLLMTTSDGRIYLFNKNGRTEKIVQAHQGAIISGTWSPDATEILTSGEDGFLRIWSRNGMLRSTLVQCPISIYCSAWGPTGETVIYGYDKNLIHRPTALGGKPFEWRAHDRLIISIAVSTASKLLISGSEDGKYKVWNLDSHLIYSSSAADFPITALAWAPSGNMFAVGGFNMLKLCDKSGWLHHQQNPKCGSIFSIHWSSDGTQFGCATSSGAVAIGSVIGKTMQWKKYVATIESRNKVRVTELKTKNKDFMDFQERVTQISINYGHLIIVIPTQVHIYNLQTIHAPIACDLKENIGVNCILQSKKNFVLCGTLGLTSRNYDGRVLCHIKWPGMRTELFSSKTVCMSDDMLAIAETASENKHIVRIYDVQNGRTLAEGLEYRNEIIQVGLAQNEMMGKTERLLAVLDKNEELTVSIIRRQGNIDLPKKLGTMIQSFIWQSEAPVLATLRGSKLRIYYFPQVVFIEYSILDQTFEEKEMGDLGRAPELISYDQSNIRVMRSDGGIIASTPSFLSNRIHRYAMKDELKKARKLCFLNNEPVFWGVLAGLALLKGELDIAETCFPQINHFDKIAFLKSIKETGDEVIKESMRQLFCHGITEAEDVLLSAKKIKEAIELNVRCTKWERALELTLKHNEDIESLIAKRTTYLAIMGIEEYLPELWTITN